MEKYTNGHKPGEEKKARIKRVLSLPAVIVISAIVLMIVGAVVVLAR